jgi:DNA excision repair protein ERCC-2
MLTLSQNLDLLEPHNLIPPGVFTFDDVLKYGEEQKQCPYFTVRRMVRFLDEIPSTNAN